MSNILIQFFERTLCSRSKNRNISLKKENQEQTGNIYIYIKMGPLQGLGVHENKQNSKSFVSTTSAAIESKGLVQKCNKIPFNKK